MKFYMKQAQTLLVGIGVIIALIIAVTIIFPAPKTTPINIAFGAENASIACMGSAHNHYLMDGNTFENNEAKISVPYPDNKITCTVSPLASKSFTEATISGHQVAVSTTNSDYRFTFATDARGNVLP